MKVNYWSSVDLIMVFFRASNEKSLLVEINHLRLSRFIEVNFYRRRWQLMHQWGICFWVAFPDGCIPNIFILLFMKNYLVLGNGYFNSNLTGSLEHQYSQFLFLFFFSVKIIVMHNSQILSGLNQICQCTDLEVGTVFNTFI